MKIKLLMLTLIVINLLSCATEQSGYFCNHKRIDVTNMQNVKAANCPNFKQKIIKDPEHGRSALKVTDRDPEANKADPEIYDCEMIFKIDNGDMIQCDYIQNVLQSCHIKEDIINLEEFI